MPWFKVDDGLHSHPKWLAASPRARALWITSGSWCASHLTDGQVPDHALPLLGGRRADATELVRLGLWDAAPGGWLFHDWETYQPSADAVEAERAAARERQRRAREKARESRRDTPRDSRASNGASHGPPDPTRPDHDIEGGGYLQAAGPDTPPSRRCPRHANDDSPPPCGPCADARRRLEAWQAARPAPEPDRADRRMEAQQAAVRARADAYTPDPTRPDPELNVSQIQAIRDKAHLPSRAALNGQETP